MNQVHQIRQFNRTLTQRIGVLDQHFLGRQRSLGASRLLFEIGLEGREIRQLRDRLGLDSGYTSRLLRGLQRDGLVEITRSAVDGRVRQVTLTESGRDEFNTLNRLSDEAALAMLEPLSEKQREDLTAAMNVVERLLCAGCVAFNIEDPGSEVAVRCLDRYYRELSQRFETPFDPSKSISASRDELTPPAGFFLVARLYGETVGCGALKCGESVAEIKRMWVAPSSRGLGIGKTILAELETLAAQQGIKLLRLETNKALVEAQALYAQCGYREVAAFNHEPYAHHWFEKRLD